MDVLRDLSHLDEYVPGRGVDEVAREHGFDPEDVVKLASNENPLGPPDAAVEAIRENAGEASVYPTALHEDVRRDVAEYAGAPERHVVLGAGADGVFDTVCRAALEDGDEILCPEPGFSYYRMAAENVGGSANTYPLEKDTGFTYEPGSVLDAYSGEKIVYLTTPNNPTGSTLSVDEIRAIADDVDGLTFVDEAYWEFSDRETAVELALERDDVGVARTFSKAWGLAGMRCGYAVLPLEVASAYRKVTTPFAVGTLTLHAVAAALTDTEHLDATTELVERGRSYLASELDVPTYPSEANFVLVDVSPRSAADVAGELERRGVVVRDTTSFGLPECIRVSIGTEEDVERVAEEINDVCA
ncbi:MAG: histidinol-phosphate transaminase [Halobacteriota archaeon]